MLGSGAIRHTAAARSAQLSASPEQTLRAPLARPGDPPSRRIALIAGVLFVITFVTSIPALLLYDPVLNDTGYITGAGGETQVLLAAFLELLLIVANIGTAVVLFPVLKRQSEPAALGFVAARVVESAFIAVGILSVLAVVTLRQDLAGGGTDPATLQTVGRSLVAIKDWTFLLGPGFVVGILIVKGFKPSPILYDDGRHAGVDGPLIPGLAAPEPAAPAMAAP